MHARGEDVTFCMEAFWKKNKEKAGSVIHPSYPNPPTHTNWSRRYEVRYIAFPLHPWAFAALLRAAHVCLYICKWACRMHR